MALIIIPWGVILLYLGFRVWGQPLDKDRTSYWQITVQGLDEEPDVFFAQIYQALKDGLATRDVQLSGMGFGPTKLFETHSILSSRPLYLEARYKHLSCYLFLGQTPTGFFLSSRTYNKFVKGEGSRGVLSYAALKYFQRQTLFQYDASIMFIESVHAIVLQVLDSYIEEKKLKPLEEYERRPILHAFYANAYPPRPQPVWAVPMSSGNPANLTPATTPHAVAPTADIVPSATPPKTLPLDLDTAPQITTPAISTITEHTVQMPNEVSDSSTRSQALDEVADEPHNSSPISAPEPSHLETSTLESATPEPLSLEDKSVEDEPQPVPSSGENAPKVTQSGRILPL